MNTFDKVLKVTGLVLALTLSACGGGHVSKTASEPTSLSPVASAIDGEVLVPVKSEPGLPVQSPAAPITLASLPLISVSERQFSDPNVLLTLRGTAVAAPGATIEKTLWTQVSGPQVRIPSPLSLENKILIPDVNIATQLQFRLTAQDNVGRINSATASILVKPVPTFVKVIGGVFNEVDERAVFSVRLNEASSVPITISYTTQDGTAKSNTDYVATYGQVVIEAGQTIKEIAVPLINDAIDEGDENFGLQVTAIDGKDTHANSGVAIVHNGKEPQLQQALQFSHRGLVSIYVDEQYTNPLDPTVVALGTGDILYASSNPAVASINAQGLITPLTTGFTDITVTKLADNDYMAASDSFRLQVLSRGTAPSVQIGQPDNYTLKPGEIAHLSASAKDVEDGPLPTQQQIADSAATGKPITSFVWDSVADGFLGYGNTLDISTLTPGAHQINCSVTDSDNNISKAQIRVIVASNIAPLATAKASSTFCTEGDCYSVNKINDNDLSTLLGHEHSWANVNIDTAPWVSLSWPSPVIINKIDLYSSEGYIIQDYDVEYFDGANSWIPVFSVTGNTQVLSSHYIAQITTQQLRVVAKKGSIAQPAYRRINELVVLGTALSSSPSSSSSISSAANSSVVFSSAASSSIRSSVASSSVTTSSALSSSIKSSSVASSSVAPSSMVNSSVRSSSVASSPVTPSSTRSSSISPSVGLQL